MNTKKQRKIIIAFIIIISIILGISLNSFATDTVTIKFEDSNLYNKVREQLGTEIDEFNTSQRSITIKSDKLANIESLSLRNAGISNISGIEKFTALKELDLSNNKISNVQKISSLSNLTMLNLSSNTELVDVTYLNQLTKLTNLNLSNTAIGTISQIDKLVSLTTLNVSNCGIGDENTIQKFTNLKSLNISENLSITNFDNIIIETLTQLDASGTGIRDISSIKRLKNLTNLNLSGCQEIEDLNCLYEKEEKKRTVNSGDYPYEETYYEPYLINLTTLSLSRMDLNYLGEISIFENLKNLELGSNQITNIDNRLIDLPLEYLGLSNNKITDLSGFIKEDYKKDSNGNYETDQDGNSIMETNTIKAKIIKLQNNEIEDISPLGHLENDNIVELDLTNNHISDISPITHLTKGVVHLEDQTLEMDVLIKENKVDQYIILPNIFQEAKKQNSIAYTKNELVQNGLKLNNDARYQSYGSYNVIIDKNKTEEDIITIQISGGNADGTILTFQMSEGDTSAVDSIMFEDAKFEEAVRNEYAKKMSENQIQYFVSATNLINSKKSDMLLFNEFEFANKGIKNVVGLSNFTALNSLNLSNNSISDASELKTLKSLNRLYIVRNNISDYSCIENMTSLQILDISNNKITSTEPLQKLIENGIYNLETLNVSNNNITDISVIKDVQSLKVLDISNTKITDINCLNNLVNLNTFNATGLGLKDINVVENFVELKSLNIANNKVKDITKLKNLPLAKIDISANDITDITPLKNISSLVSIKMDNNKIEDITNIYRLTLKEFSMTRQKILRNVDSNVTGDIQIELPQLFKDAHNSSKKYVYTTKDFELNNCRLSDDGNSVIVNGNDIKNKVATVTIKDAYADETTLYISQPIVSTITYSPKTETEGTVTAIITFERSDIRITNNEGKNTYTFDKNGSFTFEFEDENGIEGAEVATVDWIKEKPQTKSGDITGDGDIDINDITAIKRHISATTTGKNADKWTLTEEKQAFADVTGDGVIDINDISKIKRYIAANSNEEVAAQHPKWLEL